MTPPHAPETAGPMLLFDGGCGLCQRIVRLLLRLDRGGRLHFAPLQSAAAQDFLRRRGLPTGDFESLIFVPDWGRRFEAPFLQRTDGVIAALRTIGTLGRVGAAGLSVLPAPWRDAGYRLIARWRYRVFGAWHPRPLAKAAWAARFLD